MRPSLVDHGSGVGAGLDGDDEGDGRGGLAQACIVCGTLLS